MTTKNINFSPSSYLQFNFLMWARLQRLLRFDWRLVAILALAVAVRVGYVPEYGHVDLDAFYDWAVIIRDHGLLDIYHLETFYPYPPIYFISLDITNRIVEPVGQVLSDDVGLDPPYLRILKLFPILSGVGLIAVVYLWLPRGNPLRWIIPTIMAVYPGLILSSAFWGQLDAPMTLFLALALMALNRDRVFWTWIWFALALMTKFQAVVVVPVLVVLCLRRYGIKRTTAAIAVFAAISIAMMTPFMMVSGVKPVLAPFMAAVDVYPVTTAYAFNLWYAGIPSVWDIRLPNSHELINDGSRIFGLLTYKQAGFAMLGIFTLLVCANMWRRYEQRREFVWAGGLYFAFFMLTTQMHERYLHPAAVFLLVGMVQDRRLWLPALGLIFTYSYNLVVVVQRPFYWLGVDWMFVLGDVSLHVALLNMIIFARATWIMVSDEQAAGDNEGRRIFLFNRMNMGRIVWRTSAALAGLLVLAVALHTLIRDPLPEAAKPLDVVVVESARLEGYALHTFGDDWHVALYWRATTTITSDYSVMVRAEKDGETIAECIERPHGGDYPTWLWFSNRLVETTCWLLLPQGVTPDRITAGLYDHNWSAELRLTQDGVETEDWTAVLWRNS